VTFDRKIKKDAFYIYKAYLSKEPFVHLCGSRYIDRAEDITEIKVYSNLPQVALYVDGELFAEQEGDKVFKFSVPIAGKHTITAKSGAYSDEMTICHSAAPNPAYRMQQEEIVNWFDRDDEIERVGYFSINDKIADIKTNSDAAAILEAMMARVAAGYGDVSKGVKLPEDMVRRMDQMPLAGQLKMAGGAVTKEMIVGLNRRLNQVRKRSTVQPQCKQ
jgi:beta-galactosidase